MAGFADSVAEYGASVEAGLNEWTRQTILEVGRRLISRSPIDTGRFVSNWNYSLMTPDPGTSERVDVRTVNYLEDIPATSIGLVHYITNGLPYANALEYGHSPQTPPGGMVGLTEIEMPQIAREAARSAIILGGLARAVRETSNG